MPVPMPPRDPDPYATLGVARHATLLDIARAHRRLAKRHHPDVSTDTGAVARMRDLNEAWRVLSNAELRAAWDLEHRPPNMAWSVAPAPVRGRRPSPSGPARRGGVGGWVALIVASLLMVGMLAAGVASAMGQPAGPGDTTPGYHGNLD